MLVLKMEICCLEVSAPLGKFLGFDHLMLDDLPVGLAVVQGETFFAPFL